MLLISSNSFSSSFIDSRFSISSTVAVQASHKAEETGEEEAEEVISSNPGRREGVT